MSGFNRSNDQNPFNMSNGMNKTERADAVYTQMKRGYDEQREQFIQDEISEKKGRIKQKMINKESEQSIKQFITWEFNCINTYKKNKKIRRSGMNGKILGTEDVHYNNPPSFREVEEIYQEIKSSLPRELNAEEKWQAEFAKNQEAWSAQQEVDAYYDSCDSEIYGDQFADYEEEQANQKEQDAIWEKEYEERCRIADDKKKCDDREAEIKQLHEDDIGLKGICDTTRKAQIRMRAKSGKERVAGITQGNMTKEEAQKVIPTLKLGDDIEEVPQDKEELKEGQGEEEEEEKVTKYRVIKKDNGSTLHHDWKVIWKKEDFSRVKFYNPTFKLEIFDKPIKGKQQFSNEHIRKNLKDAYNEVKDESKIIVWDPVMKNGMVNIYTKMESTLYRTIEKTDERNITMGWDDTNKDNERPYYKYKQSYKDIVTYEPPMHLLSSFSYDITRTHGIDTNEKVSAEAGPKKAKGGKRKTQKKKQPKQKRAGSTKKTKKAKKGGKTSQKKGKQQKQKRGTRGKK